MCSGWCLVIILLYPATKIHTQMMGLSRLLKEMSEYRSGFSKQGSPEAMGCLTFIMVNPKIYLRTFKPI